MTTEEKFDRIVYLSESISTGKITVLTGQNGSGKSVLRKLVWQSVGDIALVSLDQRAGIDPSMGGQMFMRDVDWVPSSINTWGHIKDIVKSDCKRFIVLDEPEIGMSEESQAGLAEFLNSKKADILSKAKGVLIITHSRQMVSRLNADCFLNMEGLNKEAWLNREIVPTDFDELQSRSLELQHYIQSQLKQK